VIRAARAAYYGLITQIDYNLGRVFAALQDVGLFDDTLIVFTSDHGEYLGDHHTGAKTFFHEPSAHIPFVLRMPRSWDDRRHGTTVDSVVSHADILPTLVAAAGGEPPSDVDGQDLIALAKGQLEGPRRYLVGMAGTPHAPDYLAVTDGRWKYIWYPEGGTEQLFDLASDPHELTDLAIDATHEHRMAELRNELISRQGELVTRPREPDSTTDRRNHSWPGYHTEHHNIDVRH
jgi:arylsulfatase A-like enzyme